MPVISSLQIPIASGLYGQPNPYPNTPTTAALPVEPYSFPHTAFDQSIAELGVRVTWQKSHQCPCTWYPTDTVTRGTPNPGCLTCSGLGWYWDDPIGPFPALFSYAHSPLATDEPGTPMDLKMGQVLGGFPLLTLSHDVNFTSWQQASEFDKFTEVDAIFRFNTNLSSNRNVTLPYSQGLQIAATGAVTTFSLATSSVVPVTGYTVSGATVLIPDSYPLGTPYVVEFYANPVYITFKRSGGMPHDRPFSGGKVPVSPLPRRFRAAPLDLWIRNKNSF